MAYKENDVKLIGKNLKKLLEERKTNQVEFGKMIGYDRSLISKWINGKEFPNKNQIQVIADALQIKGDELLKNISVAIVHTSALMRNGRLLDALLEEYAEVIVPDVVIKELEDIKSRNRNSRSRQGKIAWQVLMKIAQYQVDRAQFSVETCEEYSGNTIDKIIALAKELKEDQNGDVFIIHDDISITNNYPDSLRLDDYMARREGYMGYYTVLKLRDEWEYYDEFDMSNVNVNAYLPDGMTLLIHCIRYRPDDKQEGKKLFLRDNKIKKIKFLLDHGVDINQTDRWQHCFTPLAHCVQVEDFELFEYLLERGADYNKGSIDTLNTSNFRMQNEGNTPLMIACYEAKRKFVDCMIKLPELTFNQQDANGWTALIKAAAGRNKLIDRKEKYPEKYSDKYFEREIEKYKYIYEKLDSLVEVDKKIRSKRNRTAKEYWENIEYVD